MSESDNLRSRNTTRLLEHMLEQGITSRSEIARAISISKVTVTSIVNELIDAGFLIESGRTEGVTGRPAGLVEIHPQAGTVIGLDVQPAGVLEITSDLRALEFKDRYHSLQDRQDVNQVVLESLRTAFESASFGPVRQVVIAIPAPVDANGAAMEPSSFTEFTTQTVSDWADQHGVVVRLENDVKLAALAEHQHGAAVGAHSFALLAQRSTGVALGLFLDGRMYYGEHGRSGELSLVRWLEDDQLVSLEQLPVSTRDMVLAQLVSGFAIALDLSLLLVHQDVHNVHQSSTLGRKLLDLVPKPVQVKNAIFGERGPAFGAVLMASELARGQFKRTAQTERRFLSTANRPIPLKELYLSTS